MLILAHDLSVANDKLPKLVITREQIRDIIYEYTKYYDFLFFIVQKFTYIKDDGKTALQNVFARTESNRLTDVGNIVQQTKV